MWKKKSTKSNENQRKKITNQNQERKKGKNEGKKEFVERFDFGVDCVFWWWKEKRKTQKLFIYCVIHLWNLNFDVLELKELKKIFVVFLFKGNESMVSSSSFYFRETI